MYVVGAIALLGAGCGGSSVSIDETKDCFESSGYTTSSRPDIAYAEVGPDDWYVVLDSSDEIVVTVTYFEDEDAAESAKRYVGNRLKMAAEKVGIGLTDENVDDLVRTSGNYLYWLQRGIPPTIHEDDVETCVNA